jgi:hypothetical protein
VAFPGMRWKMFRTTNNLRRTRGWRRVIGLKIAALGVCGVFQGKSKRKTSQKMANKCEARRPQCGRGAPSFAWPSRTSAHQLDPLMHVRARFVHAHPGDGCRDYSRGETIAEQTKISLCCCQACRRLGVCVRWRWVGGGGAQLHEEVMVFRVQADRNQVRNQLKTGCALLLDLNCHRVRAYGVHLHACRRGAH